MVSKRREEIRGSLVKNVRKKCWQTPSRSMGGRHGSVNSVPNPMYGRGGAAGDTTTTSQQGCGEKTGRRLRRERVSGPLVLRRHVEERTRSPKFRRQRLNNFGPRLSSFENSREEREEDWNIDCDEEVENKKKLDEKSKRLQRQRRDLERFTCMPQDVQSSIKKICNSSNRTLSKRGRILCRSTRERRRDLKRYQASMIRRQTCKRKLLPLGRRCGRSERRPMKERSAFISCRERSIAIGWQRQNWKRNFGACRQGRKEEAATPPNSLTAALMRWRGAPFRRGSG